MTTHILHGELTRENEDSPGKMAQLPAGPHPLQRDPAPLLRLLSPPGERERERERGEGRCAYTQRPSNGESLCCR